ncbi:MAG: TetR/AcrR family transcriptional regulator [Actinobacteria bacterium]|nr:TetR/AcrR family transcriptional regulator [Actinomycetota bacterium]
MFAEHGFGSTSVSMLAAASGGSKAWIYHYYPSKEAVLYDLLRTYTDDLLAVVHAADDPTLAPRDRLRALIAAILCSYDDAQSRHAAILNDLARLPEAQRREIRTAQRQVVDVVAAVLAAVDPRLADRPDVRTPITMSLFGMLNWHYRWFRPDGPMSRDDYVAMLVGLVLDGLDGVPALAERAGDDVAAPA